MNDITLLSTNYNHKMMTLCMLKSYIKYCGYDAKYLIIDNSNNLAESMTSYTELNVFDNTLILHIANGSGYKETHKALIQDLFNEVSYSELQH